MCIFALQKRTGNFNMAKFHSYSINLGGYLMQFDTPKVMGILNVTPDSFYEGCRGMGEADVISRIGQLVAEGTDMIDIGACSTKPGSQEVSVSEEMARLRFGLKLLQRLAPGIPISVDTYRADVASMCVEEFGVAVINDISGGNMDSLMFDTVARLRVPYVLTHIQGTPENMQKNPYYDIILKEVMISLADKLNRLHEMGVKDIIVDPGFGFGKTLEHNYEMMAHLEEFHLLEHPLLVGVSRKSMVYRLLDVSPDDALNGTTALHAVALLKGVHILRVHDVKACKQCVSIVERIINHKS